jgi:hypothetical protein
MGRLFINVKKNLIFIFLAALSVSGCSGSGDSPSEGIEALQPAPIVQVPVVDSLSKLWIWEDTKNTEQGLAEVYDFYKSAGVTVGVVMLDSPWAHAFNDFAVDGRRYPDLVGLVNRFRLDNVKVLAWMTPYVNTVENDPFVHPFAADFIPYSFDYGRIFRWWKGDGYLIDFSVNGASDKFFKQPKSVLSIFDGFKVDQVAQDQYFGSIGKYQEVSKTWVAAVRRNFPDKVVFSRGYSHQGGLQSNSDDVDINWGGDYTGTEDEINKQYSDLCVSINEGFVRPLFEIGGYNPPFSDAHQLEKNILVSTGFYSAGIGGKGAFVYIDLLKNNPELLVKLKYRQSIAGILDSSEGRLKCVDGVIQNELYIIAASERVNWYHSRLFDFDRGRWIDLGDIMEHSVYLIPGKFCYEYEDQKYYIAGRELSLPFKKRFLCLFSLGGSISEGAAALEREYKISSADYNLIFINSDGEITVH